MNIALNALKLSAVAMAVTATVDPLKQDDPLKKDPLLDSTGGGTDSALFSDDMRRDALSVIQEWAETAEGDLDDQEGLGDRLLALIAGTASEGEQDITDEEAEYAAAVAELVGDYLEDKGITADDVQALVGDFAFDNDVADRVHEALLDKLPQGEEAVLDDAGRFIDGEDDTLLDAAYRKTLAIRGGKKVRINKRIAGNVRLSAKQKIAVRKMQRKAFSGAAKMKRAKSLRLRRRMGL